MSFLIYIQMGLSALVLLTSKIWSIIRCYAKSQARSVIQYQTVKYYKLPLSPISRHRLSAVDNWGVYQFPVFGEAAQPKIQKWDSPLVQLDSSSFNYLLNIGKYCNKDLIIPCKDLVQQKILVLDLDETLIHSYHDGIIRQGTNHDIPPDFVLKVIIDRHPVRFFVHKRPHLDYFLETVSRWYELVIYTASMEIYGAAVTDKLDNNRGILKRRYYRQHCPIECGNYTKDLSAVTTNLSNILIVDNSPGAYRSYPDNAIPIKSWFSDPQDTQLLNLLPMLDALRFSNDVRSILSRNLHLQHT